MTKEFETMYMHKVTYSNKNSKIIHTALFTDVMEAEHFKESGECSFVGLNNWTWEIKLKTHRAGRYIPAGRVSVLVGLSLKPTPKRHKPKFKEKRNTEWHGTQSHGQSRQHEST